MRTTRSGRAAPRLPIGMLVGLGVTLESNQGVIFTVALTLKIAFLGMAVCTELLDRGPPRFRAAAIAAFLGLATVVGAIGGASHVLPGFLLLLFPPRTADEQLPPDTATSSARRFQSRWRRKSSGQCGM